MDEKQRQVYFRLKLTYNEELIDILSRAYKGKLIDPAETADIAAQSVARVIITKGYDFGKIKPYLITTAHNQACKELKIKNRFDPTSYEEYMKLQQVDIDYLKEYYDVPANYNLESILEKVISLLDERCAKLLNHFLNGSKLQKVTQLMGMKYDSVKSKKSECIRRAQKLLPR